MSLLPLVSFKQEEKRATLPKYAHYMNKGMGSQPGMAPVSSMGMMPPNTMPMGKYYLIIKSVGRIMFTMRYIDLVLKDLFLG